MSPDGFALLVLAAFAVVVPAAILLLSWRLGRPKKSLTDLTVYECGAKPFESARRPFTVKFYLTAMLFILFDVEAVFIYPWAATLKNQAHGRTAGFVLASMVVFLGVLAVGYLYALGRGALDWDR